MQSKQIALCFEKKNILQYCVSYFVLLFLLREWNKGGWGISQNAKYFQSSFFPFFNSLKCKVLSSLEKLKSRKRILNRSNFAFFNTLAWWGFVVLQVGKYFIFLVGKNMEKRRGISFTSKICKIMKSIEEFLFHAQY